MLEKLSLFLLSTLIPAGIFLQRETLVPRQNFADIEVAPLAKVNHDQLAAPNLSSSAALVIETHSNEVLFSKNVWSVHPIASLTKLMTAIVVKEKADLDKVVIVDKSVEKIGGSKMGLRPGEKILVRDLLKGLLIESGNDAAMVLSIATAGSRENFVKLMNEKKVSLGLTDTVFVDPAGLDDGNVSTAFEMAVLAKYAFKDGLLQSILREKELVITTVDQSIHRLVNTNRLLGTDIADRIIAGKTGTSPLAGEALISFISTDHDRTTLTILLHSKNRYDDMKTLISFVDHHFQWK
jgi:D-alanyl-D-alanine carboxypeptidase